jgi:hypothetical protein
MYVGVSRGESSGTIVTDDVARLRQAITGRAGEKTVAIDSDLIGRVQQAAGEALRAQGMAQTSAPASVSPDEALHRASAQDRMARMQAARDSPTAGPTTSHQQPAGRGTLEQGLTLE